MKDIAAIHREILEVAWSGGSQAIIDEVYAPDYTFVGPLAPDVTGPEGERALIAERRATFSDLRFEVHEQLVDGDRVATRWTAYGTHDGPLGPMAPTGRSGSADGVAIARFENGKLVSAWTMWDVHGLLQQLTAPEPELAAANA
jgi:predicted ester cyclase